MRQIRRFALTTTFLAALAFTSAPALGQDAKKEAAALVADGAGKFDENDFLGALDSFSRAYALYRVPTIGIYVARCQHALGRRAAALATYNDVLSQPVAADAPKQVKKAVDEAKAERQDLLQHVSWLVVQISGATSAKILVDGVEVKPQDGSKYAIDPGPHVVIARADGFGDATQQVDAVAGQERAIALTLSPSSAPAGGAAAGSGEPSVFTGPTFAEDKFAAEEKKRRAEQEAERKRQAEAQKKAAEDERKRQEAERLKREQDDRDAEQLSQLRKPYIIPGYIAAGAGALALGISYITYNSASSTKDELDQQCIDQRCPASAASDLDSAKSSANIATYTLIGGLVVGGAGVALLVKGYTISLPAKEGAWNFTLSPAGASVSHTY